MLLQPLLLALELLEAQLLARRGDGLELAAVDGHQLAGDQADLAAELHKGPTGRRECCTVVLAKISDGLEVRSQASQQPHHFDIALALGLQPPG